MTTTELATTAQITRRRRPTWRSTISLVSGVLVIGWAFNGTGVSLAALIDGWRSGANLIAELLHPDLSPEFLRIVWKALVQTVQMALVGLVISAVFGLPLAILLAGNVEAPRIVRETARWTAAVLRGVPDLLWALLLVACLGPGPAAGALALGIHGTGMLAKLGAEQLEAVDAGPVEAVRLMGAGRAAVAVLAIVPQARAGGLSLLLYQAECNIRVSTVLGFVGAGGIGQEIALSVKLFRYEQLSTLVLAVLLLMFSLDVVSRRLRRRLGAVS